MSQRHEPHDSLDFFPTPPFATRVLCEWLLAVDGSIPASLVWEPACGEGDMARPLSEYFAEVMASDVHNYAFGWTTDFLWPTLPEWVYPDTPDWIITNPPFRLAEQFARKGLEIATAGVALLVRTAFLESAERHRSLFGPQPPSDVLVFVERVPMFKGRLDRKGSTATSYAWLVWRKGAPAGTQLHWLPPCRKRLELDSDYPQDPACPRPIAPCWK